MSSDHDSDAGNRLDSPSQGGRSSYPLPRTNPANIADAAQMGSTATARKPAKRSKLSSRDEASAHSSTRDDDFADVQAPSGGENIDERPDGGYINPANIKPKGPKMKWTPERDRQLLVFGLGRDITGKEFQAIADSFEEKPTAKAIQERLTKLRAETRKALKASGIYDADAVRAQQQQNQADPRAQSERQAQATPSQRTLPVKKSRPATRSAAKTAASSASVPVPGPFALPSQPPLHQPMAPQPPVATPAPPMAHPGFPSHQHALGGAGATDFHTPHSTYGPAEFQYPSAGPPTFMAPPSYPAYQPSQQGYYPPQQGGSMYPTGAAPDLGLGPASQQYGTPYTMAPSFVPGQQMVSLAPPFPMHAPTGGAIDVPHMMPGQPELLEEEEHPVHRSERELEEKRARLDAERRSFR